MGRSASLAIPRLGDPSEGPDMEIFVFDSVSTVLTVLLALFAIAGIASVTHSAYRGDRGE